MIDEKFSRRRFIGTMVKVGMTTAAIPIIAPYQMLGLSSHQSPDDFQSSKDKSDFIQHGVAVEAARTSGAAVVIDGESKPKLAVWLRDHTGCYGLTLIDPETGDSTFQALPFETDQNPFSSIRAQNGKFYSLFGHHFVEFDPQRGEYTDVVKTEGYLAMWMTQDDRGRIWAGTYPKARIFSYTPDTREFKEYGPVNEEDWPQYPRSLAVDETGWVYAGIGTTRATIIGLNPETGKYRPMVEDEMRQKGQAKLWRGQDGNVYGRMRNKNSPWLQLREGECTVLEDKPKVGKVEEISGKQDMLFGDLPDGRVIEHLNVAQGWMNIADQNGKEHQVTFDYPSHGALIYSLTLGPDKRIYGSTGHPLYLFAYSPKEDTFRDKFLQPGGHANVLTTLEDKIYGGIYARGILFEYKPNQSDSTEHCNPCELSRGGNILLRPHAMITTSDGRYIIQTGLPGYGYTGGGMMVYDTKHSETEIYKHTELIKYHSTKALAELPNGNIIGGTTTAPGTGGKRMADQCELYIMHWPSREIIFREAILPGVQEVRELKVLNDGLVYGLGSDGTFFVFDPKIQKVVYTESLTSYYGEITGGQASRVWALGKDGMIYALFKRAIVRIEPETFKHQKLADTPVDVDVGVVLREGQLYFANGSELWSYAIEGL